MISDAILLRQLNYVLRRTDFSFLGERYEGKVRDCYRRGREQVLITTDRLSCFDVVVTCVPFKGQVLNELAVHWFKLTEDIVANHVLDVPDPNVMVVQSCEILPVEVIVRGYLAGSAWRDYEAGRPVSGVQLPSGLKQYDRLPQAILTPSTKAAEGTHDEPISEEEIVQGGLVSATLWQAVRETALALFARGAERAQTLGLILADTKYEFGLLNGKLMLADEVHTLDSSRYRTQATYAERVRSGQAPEMLDKGPTRQWPLERGYKGDGAVPEFTPEHRVKIGRHYVDSFERISGRRFEGQVGPVEGRIEGRLRERFGISQKGGE